MPTVARIVIEFGPMCPGFPDLVVASILEYSSIAQMEVWLNHKLSILASFQVVRICQ